MDCSLPDSSVHGDSPGKNTGVGCHALLQGIFPTKGSNPSLLCLLHWQACSLPLVPPGKPRKVYIIVKLLKCKGVTNVEIRIVDTSESLWRVLWLGHVLVHLGCDNKNIIDQWLKQQTFIFHSSSNNERSNEALCSLFYKGTNHIYEDSALWPNHLPKAQSPNIKTLGIKLGKGMMEPLRAELHAKYACLFTPNQKGRS